GIGFSFPRALLFLCAGAAAAALPIRPGGPATQAGAGRAVLMRSGGGPAGGGGVAIGAEVLGVLSGGSILLCAATWCTRLRLAPTRIGAFLGVPKSVGTRCSLEVEHARAH